MDAERNGMSLRDFGAVVARRSWIVITAVLVCVLASVIASALQTPIYATDAEVLIQPRGDALEPNAEFVLTASG